MEISLVKTPETRAADMDEVKNFWVFQFDGTEPVSTLSKADFLLRQLCKNRYAGSIIGREEQDYRNSKC